MNSWSTRFSFLPPFFLILFAGGGGLPPAHGDDCCGARGEAITGAGGAASHGSLQEMFGGTAGRPIRLQNNSTHEFDYQLGWKKTRVHSLEGKRLDFGGVDPITGSVPALPGETLSSILSNSTGNSGTTPTVTEEEEAACPPRYKYDGCPRPLATKFPITDAI